MISDERVCETNTTGVGRMITDQELKNLDELCENATPGPWKWCDPVDGSRERVLRGKTLVCYDPGFDSGDRALIAAAPTAISMLVEEVRQLRKQVVGYSCESPTFTYPKESPICHPGWK